MPEDKNLIELPTQGKSLRYVPVVGPPTGSRRIVHPNHREHGAELAAQFSKAISEQEDATANLSIKRIQIEECPELKLRVNSLDSPSRGVYLLSAREGETGNTCYNIAIKKGKEQNFSKKIDEYRESQSIEGKKAKNQDLCDGIKSISQAQKDSYWVDEMALFPSQEKRWVEIWLGKVDKVDKINDLADVFHKCCKQLKIVYGREALKFPERVVVSAFVNGEDIEKLLANNRNICQMRMLQQPALEICDAQKLEQKEWYENLATRCDLPGGNDPVVLLLDSGVNIHPLLKDLILPNSIKGVEYPTDSADNRNHGTGMAGLAVYGELEDVMLAHNDKVYPFRIESRKVHDIGKPRSNTLGSLIDKGINSAIVDNPHIPRVCCSAVSTDISSSWLLGSPTADSAALDKLASEHMLIIIAAGNRDPMPQTGDSIYSRESSVQNPAQAWNVVSVGSYSTKHSTDDSEEGESRIPLTDIGDISPFSPNSLSWHEGAIANKPDVVFEGGNCTLEADGQIDKTPPDYSLLALNGSFQRNDNLTSKKGYDYFTLMNGTSPAAALCAHFAAIIMRRYPHFWPETVRALIVHSARWTKQMRDNYLDKGKRKSEYQKLLALCGYGVPYLNHAIACAENRVTLIVQGELQPYKRESNSDPVSYNEMKMYEIPWPNEAIAALGDTNVNLRVTLSYMPEPNPGVPASESPSVIYPAYGLRYDLKRPLESTKEQGQRLSKALRDGTYDASVSDRGWLIGKQGNAKGSLHSDCWKGTASDLLARNSIIVYPTGGWWKNRPSHEGYTKTARFALIISLETELTGIDLYTPLKNNVENLAKVTATVTSG